jgi:hypothetical protein
MILLLNVVWIPEVGAVVVVLNPTVACQRIAIVLPLKPQTRPITLEAQIITTGQ